MLQQYLPLAVLKRINKILTFFLSHSWVATVLTACGIETVSIVPKLLITKGLVATVLTACGIET